MVREFLVRCLLNLGPYRGLFARARERADAPFERRALEALDIRVATAANDSPIPAHGPLVVAANHPHGLLDGLVLLDTIRRVRPDVRVLTNRLLAGIPDLADACFFVDPGGSRSSAARNLSALRAAQRWLARGGALIVFPAGEVAHRQGADGTSIDSSWHPMVGRLALSTGAAVVAAHIAGRNSPLFHAAGRIHSSLRTALLARELLRARGRTIAVRLGAAMRPNGETASATSATMTASIRRAVDTLGMRSRPAGSHPAIEAELSRLPHDARLVESGPMQVFLASAREIPAALEEIGRLREHTYRAIGEGTGREVDLDRFDAHYLHLFSWHRDRREIVGAYRIGAIDRIVARQGVDGLYTRTLFTYDRPLIDSISAGLELGRSFVRVEYQKEYGALALLWKGIGQFVVRHPDYRYLIGPVSISASYSPAARQLMVAFLEQHHRAGELERLVEPTHPLTPASGATRVPGGIESMNALVSAADREGKSVPVLLRHYLRLGARLVACSVDPQFSNALDALMIVDLAAVDDTILRRFLGSDAARGFLARHGASPARHAA